MSSSVAIDLSGAAALITGGSRGIGRATALLLARAGARVAVSYHHEARSANELVSAVRELGGEAMALGGDVADPAEARQLVRDVLAAWQELDVLVVNAGIWEPDEAGRGD